MSIASLLLGVSLQLATSQTAIQELDYTICPVPLADRTRLDISLSFKSIPGRHWVIALPQDYYGSPPLHQFVEKVEGTDGTMISSGAKETERSVRSSAQGLVKLRYSLSYDPRKLEDATFAPNVSSKHFHLAGCQWMLRIGGLGEERRHKIRIVDPPKDWNFYSSMGVDGRSLDLKSSYNELITAALGGTERGYYTFKIRGKPVSVSIPQPLIIPDAEVVEAVTKIIDLQRRWFADDSDDHFHVAINPKEDNIAGTCIRKHFVCFLKKDITPDQLNVLLAHEMFHNWVGNQIVIEVPKGEFGLKYQWFSEGVNEYFARKLLLKSGLLSKEKFVGLFNADLMSLRDNPNRSATLDDLTKAANEGRFDTPFTKLAYYRGPLMALRWEHILKKRGKSDLSSFLRDLFKASKNGTVGISESEFYRLADSKGIDARADFERFIQRAETIQVEGDTFGPEFALATRMEPSYQVGFDFAASRKSGIVSGVLDDSNAYRAGLRNGMKFVSTANSNRFGNSWNKAKPMTVVVLEDGKDRAIDFFPHGPLVQTMQFVRKGS